MYNEVEQRNNAVGRRRLVPEGGKRVSVIKRILNRAGGVLTLACVLSLLLSGCSGEVLDPSADPADPGLAETPLEAVDYTITFHETSWSADRKSAVATDGKNVVLIKGGVYRLSGDYAGQIQVSVAKTERVVLILDGLTVRCADSAALFVRSADIVFIEVPEGKTATLSDGASYIFENVNETKPNACVYGEDDLVFRGLGTLNIRGNYNNGIGCKNDVVLSSGHLSVAAANNGIKGGTVTLTGTADLTLRAGDDGIKSDGLGVNEGVVEVSGQAVARIACTDDAIQALNAVRITAGAHVYFDCEGQAARCDGVVEVSEGTVSVLD